MDLNTHALGPELDGSGAGAHLDALVGEAKRVDWYNKERLLERLGYVPPAEYEQAWREGQAAAQMAA